MTINEYLQESNISIESSARIIDKAIASLKITKSPSKSCSNLKIIGENVSDMPVDCWSDFQSWMVGKKDDFARLGINDVNTVDGIAAVLQAVADFKRSAAVTIRKAKIDESLNKADYNTLGTIRKEVLELFTSSSYAELNKCDKDLLGCFVILGDYFGFYDNGSVSMLMSKVGADGIQKVIFSAGDIASDSLLDKIEKAIGPKWEYYINLLKSKVAELDQFSEESNTPIEDIYRKDVPSILRFVTEIRAVFEKTTDSEGNKKEYFKYYKVYAKKGVMDTLSVSDFIEWLSKNFSRATKKCLRKADAYIAWSNSPAELAVNHFILWPEEEWAHAKLPSEWRKFLHGKAPARILNRVFFYIGSILDGHNKAQQYLAISDAGQTGKGTLVSLLERILPEGSTIRMENNAFDEANKFSLSNLKVWDAHLGIVNEYDGKSICGARGKSITGGDTIPCEVKNLSSQIQWNTTGFKLIVPSNNNFSLKGHAYRRRCIPTSFTSTHSSADNFSNEDIDALVAQGEDFLKYCWRHYQQSPFRQRDGGLWIGCPEDEELYKKGGWFVDKGNKDADGKPLLEPFRSDFDRLLRAFSYDEDINANFTVDNYDDSDLTESFEIIVSRYFDTVEDGQVRNCNFFRLIEEYAEEDSDIASAMSEALNKKGSRYVFNFSSSRWRIFKKYLENHGHKSVHTNVGNVIPGFVIKPEYLNADGTVKSPERKFVDSYNKANKYAPKPVDPVDDSDSFDVDNPAGIGDIV